MTKRVQRIGHVKSAADLFLGKDREVTINTTDKAIRVHDGATVGGIEGARADLNNVNAATVSDDGKMSSSQAGDLATTKSNVDAHIGAASGHPVATPSADGFESAADKTKLDAIEASATVDQTAAEILALLLTVDGASSELDADFLDGQSGGFYATDSEVTAALAAQLVTLRGELNAATGTKALFPQEFAPTGWTKDTDQDNKALRIISGGSGGSAAGATAFSSVFGAGKTVGDTSISIAQMPDHDHAGIYRTNIGGGGINGVVAQGVSVATISSQIVSQGGGDPHNHTLSLDLQYVDIIKATKDA